MLELSIVIPVYNVEKYLSVCLESIITAVYGNENRIEVILINDGSTDDSGNLAEKYSLLYSWMKVIHQKNAGVAVARNKGMDAAKGKWIYFMDSDDWVPRNSISDILESVKESKDTDIFLFDAYKNESGKEYVWEHFPTDITFDREDHESGQGLIKIQEEILYPKKTPLAAPWDKVYRTEFLKKKDISFNSSLRVLDDMIFNMEAFGEANKVVYHKKKIYHYRYVPSSITNSYRPNRIEEDCIVWEYIRKYIDSFSVKEGKDRERKERLTQSYYCRVIKSFSICSRLCFFHEKNPATLKSKLDYIGQVMKQEPYKTAFQKVIIENLEWRLKVVWLMVRMKCSIGVYLLYQMNQWLEKKR